MRIYWQMEKNQCMQYNAGNAGESRKTMATKYRTDDIGPTVGEWVEELWAELEKTDEDHLDTAPNDWEELEEDD